MSVVPFPPQEQSADEMDAALSDAQAALNEAAETGVMQRDPFRMAII